MELDSLTAVTDLTETIDRLVGPEPSTFADSESMEALMRQFTRFEAVVTEAAASFDASDEWAADGAKTAAAWLARRCRLPQSQARRVVGRGRALRHLPACSEAWKDGSINAAHVDTLAAVRRDSTEDQLVRDEKVLVDEATSLRFEQFSKMVAYWEQHADPDGTDECAENAPLGEMSTWSKASRGRGWERSRSTRSREPSCPTSSAASNANCSRRTGPRLASGSAGSPPAVSCPGPRASESPMP